MGYYNSFIVRIWLDEQGFSRGRIEHTRSHDGLVFTDLPAMMEFIRTHMAYPPSYAAPSDGDHKEGRIKNDSGDAAS